MKQAATMAGASAALATAGCAQSAPPSNQPSGAAAPSGAVATPADAVVETTAGRIRGFTRNGVFVFKGVPYGDTTAGENRFLPPKPVQPWTYVPPWHGGQCRRTALAPAG